VKDGSNSSPSSDKGRIEEEKKIDDAVPLMQKPFQVKP